MASSPDDPDDAADAIRARVQVLLAALEQLEGGAPAAEWTNLKSAANLSGFSDETLRRWASSGLIEAHREGGGWRINLASVFKLVGQRQRRA